MTPDRVLARFRPGMSPRTGPACLHGVLVLGVILTSGAGWTPCARGAGIFRGLSARDRTHPILLSQTGEAISLRSSGHVGPAIAPGTTPAYLAFPLHGGEHFPAGTPTLVTGTQPGETAVGPLDLTPTSQARLNADLLASRGAIVSTPDRSYAISFLPRYARALAHARSSASTGSDGPTGATGIASILGLNAPASKWTINGIPASKLSQWFQTGAKEISHLTSLGVDGVSKTFGLKVTPTSSGYNIAAQELIPPTSPQSSAGPLPVPAPEPGAWLILGLIFSAAGLKRWAVPADGDVASRSDTP
jgi:hypothetical protein